MRNLSLVLCCCLCLHTSTALAERSTLSPLPDEQCKPALESQRDVALDGAANICMLAFDENDKTGTEEVAIALIDGEVIQLKQGPAKKSLRLTQSELRTARFYYSSNQKFAIMLKITHEDSSCTGEDKCCGSNYWGTLTLLTKATKITFPIMYYRGG